MIPEYFLTRHTVREFSAKEVTPELIDGIVEAAVHAPTTGNMQLYSIIVTRDPAILARLHPAHFNQPAAVNAPLIVTFCADFNRFEHWCRLSRASAGFGNFQSFMSAVIDTVAVTQQFATIAELSGLGTCYLGTATYNAPMIAEALNLPQRVVPVASLAVGFPLDNASKGPTHRLPVEAVMHRERYSDYSDETIARSYGPIERMPENRHFVEENGKETLAQVFTDVRYPRAANEQFSTLYYDFIAKAGFPFPG